MAPGRPASVAAGRWRRSGRSGRLGAGRISTGRVVALLVVVFVVSRAVVLALGFRFDVEWEGLSIQNIDPRLLQTRLWQSLWYLHGQPPLWNALVGLSMKAGNAFWPRIWHVAFLGLGLVEVLALFALLVRLRIARGPAAVVAALFSVSPAVLVYENDFFYDYPTIVLLTVTALAVVHFVARPSPGRGLLLFGSAATLVLTRTMFQWPWLVLVAALLLVACRRNRGAVLAGCALPFLLVGAVIAKNWILYDVPSTTSWSGMMLARSAVTSLPLSERRRLVAAGKLHAVSLVTPQSPLSAYEAVGIEPAPRTGVPMLDEPGDRFFPRNFENRTFIDISRQYWQDDLWIVEHRPGAYLHSVGLGVADFFAPPTISSTRGNATKIRGYDRWFSKIVYGRLGPGKDGIFLIALYAFAIAAGTWISARRFRPGADPPTVAVAFSLLTILYVGIVGNLAEVGENYRFRLAVDPLALALAAVGIQRLVRYGRARAGSRAPA